MCVIDAASGRCLRRTAALRFSSAKKKRRSRLRMKTTVPDKIKAHIIMTDTGEKPLVMMTTKSSSVMVR